MKKLLVVLVCLSFHFSYGQYDPRAWETLEAMSKKYKEYATFKANLSSSLINDVENIREEFSCKVLVKGTKFSLTMDEQQIINNGSTVWTYLPNIEEVNIDNVDPNSQEMNPAKFYDMYKKGFKYMYLSDQVEQGVLCEEIDLVPENADAKYFKVKLMISKKDKSLVSMTMFDRSGNRFKYTISDFVANVKLQDSDFVFDVKKHPGVEVVDLR